jgi:hypothetical protein
MKESSEKIKILNMVNFEKNKTTFILCDCRSEILFLDHDYEYEGKICLSDFNKRKTIF